MITRESWLNAALDEIRDYAKVKGADPIPADCRVSVGFPGGGSARKRIGECWTRAASSIGVNELFVSPIVKTPAAMLDILVHEACHAMDDCRSGHGKAFKRNATAMGLTGKMTATVAGPELAGYLAGLVDTLPKLEQGSLSLSGRKKQSTRMLKVQCPSCEYTVRTTEKWIWFGLPTCPCGSEMVHVG
jgi:hypothetical protein